MAYWVQFQKHQPLQATSPANSSPQQAARSLGSGKDRQKLRQTAPPAAHESRQRPKSQGGPPAAASKGGAGHSGGSFRPPSGGGSGGTLSSGSPEGVKPTGSR